MPVSVSTRRKTLVAAWTVSYAMVYGTASGIVTNLASTRVILMCLNSGRADGSH